MLVGGRFERGALTVCTTHAFASMDGARPLLANITQVRVVCLAPEVWLKRPGDSTLEGMADDLDAVRQAVGSSLIRPPEPGSATA